MNILSPAVIYSCVESNWLLFFRDTLFNSRNLYTNVLRSPLWNFIGDKSLEIEAYPYMETNMYLNDSNNVSYIYYIYSLSSL